MSPYEDIQRLYLIVETQDTLRFQRHALDDAWQHIPSGGSFQNEFVNLLHPGITPESKLPVPPLPSPAPSPTPMPTPSHARPAPSVSPAKPLETTNDPTEPESVMESAMAESLHLALAYALSPSLQPLSDTGGSVRSVQVSEIHTEPKSAIENDLVETFDPGLAVGIPLPPQSSSSSESPPQVSRAGAEVEPTTQMVEDIPMVKTAPQHMEYRADPESATSSVVELMINGYSSPQMGSSEENQRSGGSRPLKTRIQMLLKSRFPRFPSQRPTPAPPEANNSESTVGRIRRAFRQGWSIMTRRRPARFGMWHISRPAPDHEAKSNSAVRKKKKKKEDGMNH